MSEGQKKKKSAKEAQMKNKSEQPSKTASKPSDKEKQLQTEVNKLRKENAALKTKQDPNKIRGDVSIETVSLHGMLVEENRKLLSEIEKYKKGETKTSSNGIELQKKIEQLENENKAKSTQISEKDKEIEMLKEQIKNIEFPGDKNGTVDDDSSKKQQFEDNKGNRDQIELQLKEKEQIIKELKTEIRKLTDEKEKQAQPEHDDRLSQQHTSKIKSLETSIADLQEDLQTANQTLQEKSNTIESLTKEKENIQEKISKLEKDASNVRNETDQQMKKLIAEKESIFTEREKLENDCSSLREKLQIKELQVKDMKNSSANSEMSTKLADDIHKKIEEINELKNKLYAAERKVTDQRTENEEKIKNLKQELKKIIEEKEKKATDHRNEYEEKIKNLKEEHKQITKEKERTIAKLQKEKTSYKRTNSGKANTGTNSLEEKLKSAQDEIDELKNRLSKVVGANIMNDNPNITDLSDENRPTKLSEKFSELYDNEWTDAFEEAENEFKTDQEGAAYLYKTLLDIFDFCKRKSGDHAKSIRNSVMTLPNSPPKRPESIEISVTYKRQLKEIRKSFAPMLVESVFENYIKDKKLDVRKKNTEKFIKKCVEICWLMNSQDPPVILDTSVVDGKSFDADKFRTYTKTGKLIDYVVWPPMLLHENGPMLCKGVAQGK